MGSVTGTQLSNCILFDSPTLREENDTKFDTLRPYYALLAASLRNRAMYKADPNGSELENIDKSKLSAPGVWAETTVT